MHVSQNFSARLDLNNDIKHKREFFRPMLKLRQFLEARIALGAL